MKIRIPTELENSVIGCVLLQPDVLVDLDWLEADHFASGAAGAAWRAIRNLEAMGTPIDLVTVLARIQHERAARGATVNELAGDEVEAMLGDCIRGVGDASNVLAYAEQVRSEAIARRVRIELGRIAEAPAASGAELLSMAMAALSKLDSTLPESTPTIIEAVKRRIRQLEELAQKRLEGASALTGYPTGVDKLDDLLGGWQPKIVSILAARPAMGKSSMGLATADASSAAGHGVHLFSLEDTEEAYADRTVSRTSGVSAESMRRSNLKREDLTNLSNAIRAIRDRKWLVDSRSGISAEDIVRSVRKYKRQNNTRVVIVDYIQLVRGRRDMSPHDRLTEIVSTFADAAKADDMAYVVMSQLNRDIEKRNDKRPQLSDLRESGSLEERAKCVVGIYRGRYYSQTPTRGIDFGPNDPAPTASEFERQVQLLVLKNNNGKTGPVMATFDGPTTRIS